MMAFLGNDDPASPGGTATLESKLPGRASTRARSWLSAAMGIVIFVAGGICGAAAVRLAPHPKPLASLSELPARVAERMQYDLGLSDAQRQSIEQVVREHQPELRRIRLRILPEMRAELEQVVDDMSAVLTPEQAKRFRAEAERRLEVHFPSGDAPASEARPTN